jgi:hypothetical protein
MTVSRHREAGFGKIAIHILSVQQDTDVSLPGTYALGTPFENHSPQNKDNQ